MIDRELATFLEGGLAIHLGTRNARLEPSSARVVAVTVEADGTHVVAYVPKVAVVRVLPDLTANGSATLVFARPIDDRACQVKGLFVGSRPAAPRERRTVTEQWEGFVAGCERIGIPRALSDQWAVWPCVAVRVRVTHLFSQTPGPGAGAPLR
jgi:hypothetical protein